MKPCSPAKSAKEPTTVPLSLIPAGLVSCPPGKSRPDNPPLLKRLKPWANSPESKYQPTELLYLLMLVNLVPQTAFGWTKEVKVEPFRMNPLLMFEFEPCVE